MNDYVLVDTLVTCDIYTENYNITVKPQVNTLMIPDNVLRTANMVEGIR